MRNLGILFLVLLWLLIGWKACTDFEVCCDGDKNVGDRTEAIAPATKLKDACPISFNWKKSKPLLCDDWSAYKDKLVSSLDEDDELQVTVYYDEDETMSVAEARGDATKTLFTPPLDPNRIKVNYVIREANESERLSAISRTDFRKLNIDANIKETADRTLIYFPYGSTSKLNNSRVESYLNDVAERVKASGERVILTGHTDNDSSTQYNLGLGQRRADVVKNYLISKGVSTSKISATSKGESQPIASNDTAAGMAKNRRTELQISN